MAIHPRFIDDPTLPGTGKVTRVFWNHDRSILAVPSAFPPLTQPPARAVYGGQQLRYRSRCIDLRCRNHLLCLTTQSFQ